MSVSGLQPAQFSWLLAPFASMAVGVLWLKSGWAALLLYHLLILAALFSNRDRVSVGILFRGFAWGPLLLMAAIAIGLTFLLTGYAIGKGFVGSKVTALTGSCGLLFVIYLLVVNPVMEEFFWRELFNSSSRFPHWTDVLFGCFHFPILILFLPVSKLPVGILFLIIGGWGWRQMRNRYGGLILPWMGHFLADLMLVIIVVTLMHS